MSLKVFLRIQGKDGEKHEMIIKIINQALTGIIEQAINVCRRPVGRHR